VHCENGKLSSAHNPQPATFFLQTTLPTILNGTVWFGAFLRWVRNASERVQWSNCVQTLFASVSFTFTEMVTMLLVAFLWVTLSKYAEATAELCNTDAPAAYQTLAGKHLMIAMYSGEQAFFDSSNESWSGYDADLLKEMAAVGEFNYTIVNLGSSNNITDYTLAAKEVLGHQDIE
jgi:hypothetical protein